MDSNEKLGPPYDARLGPPLAPKALTLDERYLQDMLEQAAHKGAREALESLGLHDEEASRDVQELRSLLEAWRSAQQTVWKTITQAITMAMLGALAAGAYMNFRGEK
jgi:hypothetical protein